MEKEGVLRLFSADQIPILLSVAYDDEEITRLTKMMEKVAEKLIGGRITNQVIPEIRYSASILYILACCLPDVLKHREESDGISTLGQSFCGLSLFESTPSLSSSSSASSFQSLALSRCLLFAALHGASKYISTRRSLILPPLIEAVQVLFSSETSTTDGVSSLTETPLNTTPPYAELCQNTLNSYIITPAQEAVSKLWSAAGDSSNARWDSIQAVWSAVHDLLFFASSRGAQRFPTLATRLSRVIFLRTRPSSSQVCSIS